MYDMNSLKRLISKKGSQAVLSLLTSPEFPEAIKRELAKDGLFDKKGSLNIKLFNSLADCFI